jgi:hypothetical protein
VYQAAKMLLPRSVKSMPQPDSPGFQKSPLFAPGDFVSVVAH